MTQQLPPHLERLEQEHPDLVLERWQRGTLGDLLKAKLKNPS